ncbi:MAG: M48 family metalloprotease [Saprospiraceae bacterium]|nr:M48 family metalloprotease [Saprospiraceae bacterium]
MKHTILILSFPLLFILQGCEFTKKAVGNINLFPVEEDIKLGKQVASEIASKPAEFPILPEQGNERVYNYIRNITRKILNSGQVKYKNEFVWQVKIIKDDKTLNAFATPGGYIYVYTGLIKFLDSEDQLAGVMGHEIAHADRRHSTKQMTQLLGVQILLAAALGDREAVQQVATGLIGLKFSRNHEADADEYSVRYLCGTHYNASGAAGFFQKLSGQASPPEFLSTHPNPGNRVKDIEAKEAEFGCRGTVTNVSEYAQIKALL